jgi:hypothetical protein
MTDFVGPVVTGGFEVFVSQDEVWAGYTLLVLPYYSNDGLQLERKTPFDATFSKGCISAVPRPQRRSIPLAPLHTRFRRGRCWHPGLRERGGYGRCTER